MIKLLFADDTTKVADTKEKLRVYKRCILRVNESKSKIMKCMKIECSRRMNEGLNKELLGEVDYIKYLRLHVDVDGRIDVEEKFRMNVVGKVREE